MEIDPRPPPVDRARRSFLKALGVGALSLPFYRLLASSVSDAQSAASPLRLVVIFNPLGRPIEYWRPQASGSSYTLTFANSILAPLQKYQDRMIILDGIDCVPEIKYGDFGHEASPSVLTGDVNKQMADVRPTVESLDQFLGDQAAIGGQTRFRSLEMSVGGCKYPDRVMSWLAGGVPVPRMLNPYETFKTVFSGFVPPATDGGTSGPSQAAIDSAFRQKSVLDYVVSDVGRLKRKLGPLELQKLDQHLSAVSDLEARLTGGILDGGVPSASPAACAPPTSIPDQATWVGLYNEDPNNRIYFDSPTYGSWMFDHVQEWSDLQIQMIAQSLACDLTRVITLQYFEDGVDGGAPWAQPNMPVSNPWYDPHVCTHADDGTPGRDEAMAIYQSWFSAQVAKLMDALAAIPEGNGTVLDHTLIYWTNENGDVHDLSNIPMVLAGGANGLLQMGRWLQYPDSTLTPHNQLLVSIANLFPGVSINSYGNTPTYNWGTGGLPNL